MPREGLGLRGWEAGCRNDCIFPERRGGMEVDGEGAGLGEDPEGRTGLGTGTALGRRRKGISASSETVATEANGTEPEPVADAAKTPSSCMLSVGAGGRRTRSAQESRSAAERGR